MNIGKPSFGASNQMLAHFMFDTIITLKSQDYTQSKKKKINKYKTVTRVRNQLWGKLNKTQKTVQDFSSQETNVETRPI